MKQIKRRGIRKEYMTYGHLMADTLSAGYGTAPADMLPEGLLRREYAWRKADIMSEFGVPLCISCGYAMIGAGTGAVLANIMYVAPGPVVALVALVTGSVAYIVTTKRQLQSLWTVEEYGEEEATEVRGLLPAPEVVKSVRLEIEEKRNGRTHSLKFLDLPISDHKLLALARHLVASKRFSRDVLEKASILTKDEYTEVKRILLNVGFLREIDRKGTTELTSAGKSMFTKLMQEYGDLSP